MMFTPSDPLADPLDGVDVLSIVATIRVAADVTAAGQQPVWLVQEDGTTWRVADRPDPCWSAVNGQKMCVEGTAGDEQGWFTVQRMHCPEPEMHHDVVEVGPEVTMVGTLALRTAAQGRGRRWQWSELVTETALGAVMLFNRADLSAEVGQRVEVVGRTVRLSPFVAHMTGPRLCVIRARVLEA